MPRLVPHRCIARGGRSPRFRLPSLPLRLFSSLSSSRTRKVGTMEPFHLEEYLGKREFTCKYMLCGSDIESRSVADVLAMASEAERERFLNTSLAYTLPEGSTLLREKISELYLSASPSDILCFGGAQEAIYAAARSFLTPDDHAITVVPCYQSLHSVAASICPVSTVEVKEREGEWSLDVGEIERSIRPNTRLLFLNFPHNPTGYIPSQEVLADIVDLCRKNNLILFSDEVYRGIDLDVDADGVPRSPIPSLVDVYERAVSLSVLSKSFGLPGLRIGWVASRDKSLLRSLSSYKNYLSICNSAPSEALAEIVLARNMQILNENNALVRANLSLAEAYFTSSPLFEWIPPKGGCIAYPRLSSNGEGSSTTGRIDRIADELFDETGTLILPSSVYGQHNDHFRIGFGRKDFSDGLEMFKEFFDRK